MMLERKELQRGPPYPPLPSVAVTTQTVTQGLEPKESALSTRYTEAGAADSTGIWKKGNQ